MAPAKGAGQRKGRNAGLAFRVMDFQAKLKIQREKREERAGRVEACPLP
jgi:hypothetical protein